jgi:[ribosomal protein S18]-alanine N-acetyltransferase
MAGVPYLLRDFHRDDFEVLWRIDQECFAPGTSYSRPELLAYMRQPGSFTLVAEATPSKAEDEQSRSKDKAQVLGFLVGHVNPHGAGHIITIDVLPAFRRSGVGSALLNAAEQRLRSARCRYVRLETAVNNAAAIAFYKRHQYQIAKTLPRYYPDGLDAFVLQKDLLFQAPDR